MEKKKAYKSYLDSLSSGYDAEGYDQEQIGLDHEQEVASEDNWGSDKRDAIGRAAHITDKKLRLAKKLLRISRELEALGKMEEQYKSEIEEMEDDPTSMEMGTDDFDEKNDESDLDDMDFEDDASDESWLDPKSEEKEASKKEAVHPIEHDPSKDDPEAFRDSDMGDAEWISIGPGTFDDERDQIGKATK